jgi:hypothetical protein
LRVISRGEYSKRSAAGEAQLYPVAETDHIY